MHFTLSYSQFYAESFTFPNHSAEISTRKDEDSWEYHISTYHTCVLMSVSSVHIFLDKEVFT